MSLASLIQHRNRLRRDLADGRVPRGMEYAAVNTLRRLNNNIMAMSNRTRIPIEVIDGDVRIEQDLPEPSPESLPPRSMFASNGAYDDEAEMYYTQTGKRVYALNE